jgi:hypothetical protein
MTKEDTYHLVNLAARLCQRHDYDPPDAYGVLLTHADFVFAESTRGTPHGTVIDAVILKEKHKCNPRCGKTPVDNDTRR